MRRRQPHGDENRKVIEEKIETEYDKIRELQRQSNELKEQSLTITEKTAAKIQEASNLRKQSVELRKTAAQHLRTVERLRKECTETDTAVQSRVSASIVAGTLGDKAKAAIPGLTAVIKYDSDKRVRLAAENALKRLDPAEFKKLSPIFGADEK